MLVLLEGAAASCVAVLVLLEGARGELWSLRVGVAPGCQMLIYGSDRFGVWVLVSCCPAPQISFAIWGPC